MNEKIKNILFEIIYNELELNNIEQAFISKNVPYKLIENPTKEKLISKYFFLKNDIYLDRLSKEEIGMLRDYFDSNDLKLKSKVYEFLNQNKLKLLLPETNEKYLCWGVTSFEYMAPSDSIVIAFHTLDFLDEDETSKFERNIFVNDILNNIQNESVKKNNYKVSFIRYNEIPINTLRKI